MKMLTNTYYKLLRITGIHPVCAGLMIALDFVLVPEDAVPMVGLVISSVIGVLTVFPFAWWQHKNFGDSWMPALAKGIFFGAITAVPTNILSAITAISGFIGLCKARVDIKNKLNSQ